jgi:hypothetical protein
VDLKKALKKSEEEASAARARPRASAEDVSAGVSSSRARSLKPSDVPAVARSPKSSRSGSTGASSKGGNNR